MYVVNSFFVMTPLKLLQNFKYKFIFSGSIPFSTNSTFTLVSSNPLVSFGSNKSKAHVVVDVNFNAIVGGVVTSTNVAILRIYHVGFTKVRKNL